MESRSWWREGNPWVWLNAGAVSICIIMVVGLLTLIAVRGLAHFWPHAIISYQLTGNEEVTGILAGRETVSAVQAKTGVEGDAEVERILVKTANRDILGSDFRWIDLPDVRSQNQPGDVFIAERLEWGDLYGRLLAVRQQGETIAEGPAAWPVLRQRLERVAQLRRQARGLEKAEIGRVNHRLERLRLAERGAELKGGPDASRRDEFSRQRGALQERYLELESELNEVYQALGRDSLVAAATGGQTVELPLGQIVRIYQPNAMGLTEKTGFYLAKVWEFVSDDPRESNTEGGIFPAIFGTVLMVILMSIMVTPLGVIAAVYMREYAKQGLITRAIRVAVNNLAGVPSIVYGVFGLGFFVYTLGGSLDALFYPEALPSPTFGTGGLLWASLTLALLTLPVVIVSTEEGLSRVPRAIREGSLALGATKAETLWRTVIPMASPAVMTGVILAVARAAGEVAPLMLVGVVKLAPSLALDSNYPFLHAERKFMHLGFHIYDVAFQSPNVEASRPLIYATALLLVVVIVLLNVVAIRIRNRLREKYRALEN